jgi:hypothetical protein
MRRTRTKEARGLKLAADKRLLLRGEEGDIILSAAMVGVGPVTRCIPKAGLVGKGVEVFMSSGDRELIEHWLETGEVSLLQADPPEGLGAGSDAAEAPYRLRVSNGLGASPRIVPFLRHTPDSDVTHFQVDFRREAFRPDWTATVEPIWFAGLRHVWADPWFSELGQHNQIIRPHNTTLGLRVTAEKLEICYNRRKGHPPPSESFPFPAPIHSLSEAQETVYFSKDLAPILFNLADADIRDRATIEGNQHVLVFRYGTSVGEFEIAIPTLTEDEAQRDETLFCRWRAPKT